MNLLLKAMNQAKVEETTEEVDEPIAINYEINEKVVAKITKQVDSVSLTLPELAEDCTHHFVSAVKNDQLQTHEALTEAELLLQTIPNEPELHHRSHTSGWSRCNSIPSRGS